MINKVHINMCPILDGYGVIALPVHYFGAGRGGWSASRCYRFTPYNIVQDATM